MRGSTAKPRPRPSRTNLVLDLRRIAFGQPNTLELLGGCQRWSNKFGKDHRTIAGSIESTILVGFAVHAPN